MNITFRRISTGHVRPDRSWNKGIILATVDGHGVALIAGKGWNCRCPDPECPHVDAVADLIDLDVLLSIENGRPAESGDEA